MKLAEAILERDVLKHRLEALESRLSSEHTSSRHRTQWLEELQYTASQVRDLSIAIDWTESNNSLYQLSISGHRHKIQANFYLAKVFEKIDPDKADELWHSAMEDFKVIKAATWIVDLQIPRTQKVPGKQTEEEY